jgi:hypothetical protein
MSSNSSDIYSLLNKLSSQEKKINELLSINIKLNSKNNELNSILQNNIMNYEKETNRYNTELKELNSKYDLLSIANHQRNIKLIALTNSNLTKDLELNNLLSKYNQVKNDLKIANERNNEYIQKLADIEANYSQQFQTLNDSFEELKKKIKLITKPRIN